MEDPAPFAGPHVVAADEPGDVFFGRRKGPLRRPDDDDVFDDDRWRRRPDDAVPGSRSVEAIVEIDDPLETEPRIGLPGLRVEGDQIEAGCDVDDPLRGAIGPVRHASVIPAGRRLAATPLVEAPDPQRFPGLGIDRNNVALGSGRDVQHTIDHERRGLVVGLRTRPEVLRLPAPRDREVLDGVLINLIERCVSCAAGVAVVEAPLAVGGSGLRRRNGGCTEQARDEYEAPRADTKRCHGHPALPWRACGTLIPSRHTQHQREFILAETVEQSLAMSRSSSQGNCARSASVR